MTINLARIIRFIGYLVPFIWIAIVRFLFGKPSEIVSFGILGG